VPGIATGAGAEFQNTGASRQPIQDGVKPWRPLPVAMSRVSRGIFGIKTQCRIVGQEDGLLK